MDLPEAVDNWFPRSAVQSISKLSLGNLFEYKAGFLYGVGGAYMLGADDWGQLVFVISLVRLFILIFDLQLGNPTIKLFRDRLENNTNLRIRELLIAVVLVQTGSLILFGILFFGFLVFFAPYFEIISTWQTALGLFGLAECFYVLRGWFGSLLISYEKFGWKSIQNVWTSIWRDYVVLGFMFFGGIEGACLGFLVSELIILGSLVGLGFYLWGSCLYDDKPYKLSSVKEAVVYAYYNTRSNYASNLLSKLFDELSRVILGGLSGVRSLGIYDIAMKFKKILTFVTRPVTSYLFPRLVGKWERADRSEFFYTLRKYFYQLGPTYVVMTSLVMVSAPWLLPLLYSNEFTASVSVLIVILPAFALDQLTSIFRQLAFVVNHQRSLVIERIIEVALALPLVYFLILNFGYMGAAWAIVVRIGLTTTYKIYFFHQNFGWRWIVPR
jgi:O-antigen/teichoic acid export membrane protein